MTLPTLALIHSPLVTASTWTYLTPVLQQAGYPVAVATLRDSLPSAKHWWQQHVESAVQSLAGLNAPYLLVGHSGAGPLLPLIAQHLPTPPIGYLFVDAGILWEPASRLQMMVAENEAWGKEFEAYLRAGGMFPAWTDEQLTDILPDAHLRQEVLASVRAKEISFFEEMLPIPEGWDTVPCGYLQLSKSYQPYSNSARAKGWTVKEMVGHHFAMMTDPTVIAGAISEITHVLLSDDETSGV